MGPKGKSFLFISLKERKQFFGILPITYTWAEEVPGAFLAGGGGWGVCVGFFAAQVGVGKWGLGVIRVTF